MKDQSVIYYGLTQMTDVDGVFHQEVPGTHSDKIFQSNSTIQMTWNS